MAYVLIARMTAREGEEERAAGIIRELVEATRSEPGNVHYVAHRSVDDPRVFLLYEQYRDKAAFEEHGQTEHFQRLGPGALFGLMEERERTFYETLD
jgi:quinol monooxygenase YgiN